MALAPAKYSPGDFVIVLEGRYQISKEFEVRGVPTRIASMTPKIIKRAQFQNRRHIANPGHEHHTYTGWAYMLFDDTHVVIEEFLRPVESALDESFELDLIVDESSHPARTK